jgi:hypothetical protein
MSKILACNQKIVDAMIVAGQIPEQYLSENYKEKYHNIKENFPVDKFFYDRSGTIKHYLNVDSSRNPIPTAKTFDLSFNEVVETRAKELLNLGKPINVAWSGGLDSTFILFTLYHYANDKSQIKVYGTYSSIIESGYMFDKHIKDKFKFNIHTNKSYENNFKIPDNEIVVTGSPGNDLFYKDIDFSVNTYDKWMKFKNPVVNPVFVYADSPYYDVLEDSNLQFLEEFIKKSPRKIEILQDLRWWVCFCFNWYTTVNNCSVGVCPETAKKIHAFYNTEEFQLWSMYNKDPTTKVGDYSDDRWQLREMIAEYTGDTFYANNKQNFLSVLSSFGDKWLFLLNDYSNVYLDDLQISTSLSYK